MKHKQLIPTWLKPALLPDGHRYTFMSSIDFAKRFSDDEKCLQYLINL